MGHETAKMLTEPSGWINGAYFQVSLVFLGVVVGFIFNNFLGPWISFRIRQRQNHRRATKLKEREQKIVEQENRKCYLQRSYQEDKSLGQLRLFDSLATIIDKIVIGMMATGLGQFTFPATRLFMSAIGVTLFYSAAKSLWGFRDTLILFESVHMDEQFGNLQEQLGASNFDKPASSIHDSGRE